MKKALKIIKKVVVYSLITFVVVIVAAGIAVKIFVTKDFVAEQIEKNINGRVEIKDISVPIWSVLSGITIDDFKIGYADAEMSKPMDQRSPMQNPVISFEQFNFKVAIGKLITSAGKNFELKSLLLIKPKAHVVLYAKGGNNLLPLLMKKLTPEEAAKKKEEAEKAKLETKAKKKEPEPAKVPSEPFSIKSIPTAIKMGKIGMEGGYFTVNVEAVGNTMVVSNARFLLKDILIDPADLARKNQILLSMGMDLTLKENKGKGIKSFFVGFDSNGKITPFNSSTGRLTESVTLRLGLKKGTYVTGLALFEKVKAHSENLAKIGVNLNFLGETQTLIQDAMATIYYNGGTVTFQEPPALVTSDFSFRLTKDDYINVKSKDHKIRGDLMLDKKHTKVVEGQIETNLAKAIGPAISGLPGAIKDKAAAEITPAKMRAGIMAPVMKDGQITLGIESTSAFTSPNVKITKPVFPDAKTLIKAEVDKLAGNVKGMITGEVNKAVDKAKAEVDKKKKEAEAKAKAAADKAKKDAEAKAAEELKKNLPKIPGF